MTRARVGATIWSLAVAVALLGPPPATAAGPGLLDGRTFAGQTGERGKDAGDKETFVFADGIFDPLGCHPYGFTGAPYTAKKDGDAVRFEAETTSPKEGTMSWTGTVRRDGLEGTMIWRKEGQAPIEYWFKGKQKR